MNALPTLPIDDIQPDLARSLAERTGLVLQAPPGAGKTTRVPLAVLDHEWLGGQRILMLEPRRLAARAAAHHMAGLLGESVGETVGYRVRSESRVSSRTRIEVLTEGVLVRLLHADPTLDGIGVVIFDEVHERSLHAEVALALTLYSQAMLRPDLRVMAMSATVDGTRFARLLPNSAVIAAEGRAFPVTTLYQPPHAGVSPLVALPAVIEAAMRDHSGDALVFLPGAYEIQSAEHALHHRALPGGTTIIPLHGSLGLEDQHRAIAPSPPGARKVVLATSIAETSLTIEGVRVVIDAGLARVPRFSPATGMTRLHTTRVTRAAADQRRGRAGRVAPGVCIRLWHAHETEQLVPYATPEILEADLAPLALDLAMSGIRDPDELRWLDAPPSAALAQGRTLLRELGAIDSAWQATAHGRRMANVGTHPRLAHMLCVAEDRGVASLGAILAALLEERDILRRGEVPPPTDVRLRVDALRGKATGYEVDRNAVRRARDVAGRWSRQKHEATTDDDQWTGVLLAHAYPDRIALRRPGAGNRFAMRSGGGAVMPDDDALAGAALLSIAETDGRRPDARIRLAAPLQEADLLREFSSDIETRTVVEWDHARNEVRGRRETRLGELVLSAALLSDPDPALVRAAVRDEITRQGLSLLPWSEAAQALRRRLSLAHVHEKSWPDVSDSALLAQLDEWLGPALEQVQRGSDLTRVDVAQSLLTLLTWKQRATLDELVPTHWQVPTGSRIAIDYADPSAPVLAVRLQEMFGCAQTPRILGDRVPLTLHLLSPAHRPVQVTQDLHGFWTNSYFDVRKDLRGRYPKHAWPDDPLAAQPTRRTRRAGESS